MRRRAVVAGATRSIRRSKMYPYLHKSIIPHLKPCVSYVLVSTLPCLGAAATAPISDTLRKQLVRLNVLSFGLIKHSTTTQSKEISGIPVKGNDTPAAIARSKCVVQLDNYARKIVFLTANLLTCDNEK